MTSSGVAQLRCLGSALPAFSTSVAGGANDRHSGHGVRPRRGFYSTEIIIYCPKGIKCLKQTGDLVSSSCCEGCEGGAVFWKEGSR